MPSVDPSVCLVVLNARRIRESLASIAAIDCHKAYLRGYSERGLCQAMAALVEGTNYRAYAVVSDDVVVRQSALEAVVKLLDDGHPVASGFCNLDRKSPLVNLTTTELRGDRPSVGSYDWMERAAAQRYRDVIPTGFAGMCLTAMSRDMWQRFPFATYGNPGYGSDFHMCARLRDAGIPIVASRKAYCWHLKEIWNTLDLAEDRRLHIGGTDQGIHLVEGREPCVPFASHQLAESTSVDVGSTTG